MRCLFFVLFFQGAAAGVLRAQPALPAVRWTFAENRLGPPPSAAAVLTVTFRGPGRLPPTGWKIYFNSNRAVDTVSEEGELRVWHVNGDLFCVAPGGRSLTLGVRSLARGVRERQGAGERQAGAGTGAGERQAGERRAGAGTGERELRVRYVCSDLSMNISDAPTGFFLVWDSLPGRGFPLPDLTVGRIDDPKQPEMTPADEYRRNGRLSDIPLERLPLVFPTPESCRVLPGRFGLDGVTMVFADRAFRREAKYLAEALAPVLGRRLRVHLGTGAAALGGSAATVGGGPAAAGGGAAAAGGSAAAARATIVLERAQMDSTAYTLQVGGTGVRLAACSAEGIFYGVQTLLGLVGPGTVLPMVSVRDRPRFAYRGLMIDVARNFRGPRELRRILDLMAFCKLNVLHLHLSDDEGWRLAIPGIPELTAVGGKRGWPVEGMLPPSFGSGPVAGNSPGSGYYSREEFIGLLRYARDRHIRVIPEIECPGHARAAIRAMDDRYTSYCRRGLAGVGAEYLLRDTLDRSVYEGAQLWKDNVVCPALPSVYRFIDKVVAEIAAMYREAGAPLSTIHLGGDEVPAGVWERSPACLQLAGSRAPAELRRYCWDFFYSRLDSILRRSGLGLSAWEEAALPGRDFTVYVWDNMIGGGNEDLPYRLANAGHQVVLACVSNNYYDLAYEPVFDEPGYHWAGFLDMEKPFSFIPYDYYRNSLVDWQGRPVAAGYFDNKEKLTAAGRRNILGIEGLLWGENLFSDARAEYMLLPKLLGTAERAWAPDPAWGTGDDTAWKAWDDPAGGRGPGADRAADVEAGGRGSPCDYDSALNIFLNLVAKRLLPRLARLDGGFAYRVPPPGVLCKHGRVWANCPLPGFTIRYTTDGSEPTVLSPRYTGPLPYREGLRLRVFDTMGRGGREAVVEEDAGHMADGRAAGQKHKQL